jgi:ubiquitin C-terminal hydrolase
MNCFCDVQFNSFIFLPSFHQVSSILSNIKSKLSHLQLDVSDTVASTSVMTPKSSTNTKEAASSTKLSSILQQHRLWSSTAEALSRNMEGGQCGLSNLGNTCFMVCILEFRLVAVYITSFNNSIILSECMFARLASLSPAHCVVLSIFCIFSLLAAFVALHRR